MSKANSLCDHLLDKKSYSDSGSKSVFFYSCVNYVKCPFKNFCASALLFVLAQTSWIRCTKTLLEQTHTYLRHTLNRAVMFIPGGPSELHTPLFLVRQLQVSWSVRSLWGRYRTCSDISTHLQLQNTKGSCHKNMTQNKRGFFCYMNVFL